MAGTKFNNPSGAGGAKAPEPLVVDWLDNQPSESVYIPTVALFETRLGVALLPAVAAEIGSGIPSVDDRNFEGRVLVFDHPSAESGGAPLL